MGSDPFGPDEMGPLWKQFCAGDFKITVDSRFPLAAAADAQQKMIESDFFGKILLIP